MSNVFISYKRENLAAVQLIVQELRGAGEAVWWDQDIAPDDPWEATIERELEAAKVVIVAWSNAAVGSENVKAEARRARNQGKLIQVFVEACEPPLFFGERQGVDLSSWSGETNDPRFQTVLTAARAIKAGKKPPQGVGYAPRKRAPWGVLTALFVGVSAALGFVSNLGGARDAVCGMPLAEATCLSWGLIQPEPTPSAPVESVERQQARLLDGVSGVWSRLDRECNETVSFEIEREGAIARIRSTAPNFESIMQVMTIDPSAGVITARASAPNEAGVRELWEYRPDGDVLAMRDPAGVDTTLARCGE